MVSNLNVTCWAAHMHLHALDKGAKGFDLCPKEQISKLSISEEDDEEHDCKSQDIFSTSTQCGGQLCHCLVKANVLENLQRQEESKLCLGWWLSRIMFRRAELKWEVYVLYLDPRKEQVHSIHVVVLCLPECQKFKISVDIRVFQQFAK